MPYGRVAFLVSALGWWGGNDRGSLSTEVYVRLYLSKRIALEAGYQWLTAEAIMRNRKTLISNGRFRHRAGLRGTDISSVLLICSFSTQRL